VRVHEELLAGGAALSYQALTAFCRRHGIGQTPTTPVGRYDFERLCFKSSAKALDIDRVKQNWVMMFQSH
jgi:hypothetical protein